MPNDYPDEGLPSDEELTPDQQNRVSALESQSSSKELTPLQSFLTKITWVVTSAALACVIFICVVWATHLPPVPSTTASAEEVATYQELSRTAAEDVDGIIKDVFVNVLMPIFTLVIGALLGKEIKIKKPE